MLAAGCDQQAISFNCVMPTTIPTNPSVVLYFGGSDPSDINRVTDEAFAKCQAPVWWPNADRTVAYPGRKLTQAQNAAGYENHDITIIGYSAGADAALIFADMYLKQKQAGNGGTGRILDLALLGPTLSGGMDVGTLQVQWKDVLTSVLASGTNIYLLDDDANEYCLNNACVVIEEFTQPIGASGKYERVSRPDLEHYDYDAPWCEEGNGTNNDPNLVPPILQWLRDN